MFGKRLKELRAERSITQKELAGKLEMSQQTVAKWEQNISTPDFENLVKIAKIFNVSTDYLLGVCDERNGGRQESDFLYALFGSNSDITDEMLEEVKRYARLKHAQHMYDIIVNNPESGKSE